MRYFYIVLGKEFGKILSNTTHILKIEKHNGYSINFKFYAY